MTAAIALNLMDAMERDAQSADWTVKVERLEIQLPVGIYDDERLPQTVWVSVTAHGRASAVPQHLAQCLDYEPLCHWLTQVWPATPHTPLLETRVNELLAFVFGLDDRVSSAWVGLYKQRMSRHAVAVGIERRSTRADFMAQRALALRQALAISA